MTELTKFPLILDSSGSCSYGGNQKWYPSKWRRLAGCAAVSAANIAAYYEIGICQDIPGKDDHRIYSLDSFLGLMNRMITYMKPGLRGFPDRDKYEDRFIKYVTDCGSSVVTDRCMRWDNPDTARKFVRAHLTDGEPVALLILTHAEKALEEETWHWMTITGYDETNDKLLLSNYGRRQTMDAGLAFSVHRKNDVKLTAFSMS